MSSQNKASQKQIDRIVENCKDLYTGSASTIMTFSREYSFLNAVGRAVADPTSENKQTAAKELYAVIDKMVENQKKREKSTPAQSEAIPAA